MNKTKIEWCDYTINPIKGMCKNDCWYCYAKRMYERFGWDKKIRVDDKCLKDLDEIKKPSKIFVGSMHDLFGDWIEDKFISGLIFYLSHYPQHIFIFLTKYPKRYSEFTFPSNCWLGTTITGEEKPIEQYRKTQALHEIKKNLKFVSCEPLLGRVQIQEWVDWVIVGGLTPKAKHDVDWVNEIIIDCKKYDEIPIFLKDNLKWHKEIKEYPEN